MGHTSGPREENNDRESQPAPDRVTAPAFRHQAPILKFSVLNFRPLSNLSGGRLNEELNTQNSAVVCSRDGRTTKALRVGGGFRISHFELAGLGAMDPHNILRIPSFFPARDNRSFEQHQSNAKKKGGTAMYVETLWPIIWFVPLIMWLRPKN